MASSNGPAAALPQTIQEVESLVIQLYQPGHQPQELFEIQSRLQQLQRSDLGWKIGHELLGSSNPVVRFFGALTFTVKLNSSGASMDREIRSSVGESLLHWIVYYSINKDDRVVRKLSSTLALFHLSTLDDLHMCVSQLTSSILGITGQVQSVSTVDGSLLLQIVPKCMVTILLFLSSLAEESGKMLSVAPPAQHSKFLEPLENNLGDIFFLIKFSLQEYNPSPIGSVDRKDWCDASVACISAWTHFNINWCDNKDTTLKELRSCLKGAITWCYESSSEDSIEQVADLLSKCGTVFDKVQMESVSQLLRGPWGTEQLGEVLQSGYPSQFVSLLLAYGDLTLQDLLKDINNEEKSAAARAILDMMQALMCCPGYPTIDDDVIAQALEFWNSFVEHVEDCEGEGISAPWISYANEHLVRMVEQIWSKVRFPPTETWSGLDLENKRAFGSFRTDTRDLLQSTYRLLGTPLVQNFADRCASSLTAQSWTEVEASLFCLSALVLATNEENDEIIAALFETPLYAELARSDIDIPLRTRRTAVDFVGQYTPFFKRNTQYLPQALNFLFSSLQDSSVSNEAARSVSSLCSQCRDSLVSELDSFFHQYEVFLTWPTANEFTIQKVAGAIAAIVQSLPTAEATIAGTQRLLDFVERGIETAEARIFNGQPEEGKRLASISMHCLSNIARCLQGPIDLEVSNPTGGDELSDTPELDNVKGRICSIISNALAVLGNDGEIIGEICEVIKAGLTEPESSPFHLAADEVVLFIRSTQIDTPRLDSVLMMACSFLRAHKPGSRKDFDPPVSMLLKYLAELIQALGDPRNDAEVAQGLIDVLSRFMPNYVTILLQLQPSSQLEAVFRFVLYCLEIPEPLPKRSAASFWGAFLDLKGEDVHVAQSLLDEVLTLFGPLLAAALIRQIAGNAMRTDLDFLCVPLSKLMKRHPQARSWLEAGLMSHDVPQTVEVAERRRFLQQLGVTESARGRKEIVTAFWSLCRGLSTQYAPIR